MRFVRGLGGYSDALAHVVVLAQVEELADLARTLWSAHARLLLIRQP